MKKFWSLWNISWYLNFLLKRSMDEYDDEEDYDDGEEEELDEEKRGRRGLCRGGKRVWRRRGGGGRGDFTTFNRNFWVFGDDFHW